MKQVINIITITQQGEGRTGVIRFPFCCNINTDEDIESYTDTAVVRLPRNINWQDKNITDLIKRDDKIKIELGYDNDLHEVFNGYVISVSAGSPFDIKCENEMYMLKKQKVMFDYKSVNLSDLMKKIISSGITYKTDSVEIGAIRTKNNPTVLQVFEEIANYGLIAYFRDGILYVGKKYWIDYRQEKKQLDFSWNILPNSNISFRIKEEINVKVKVIVRKKDNSTFEVEYGKGTDIYTFQRYNIDKDAAKAYAEQKANELSYDGYVGTIELRGIPFVRKGDLVKLIDPKYADRTDTYFVKKVSREFGTNGYNQTITLDRKESR